MPRYAVHSSAAPTPVLKIRPASASTALGWVSVVVIPITPSHRGIRHQGVSSGLASSGPPADGFLRLVAAETAGAYRVAEVPGKGVVLTGDGGDRRPNAHRDRFTGTLRRVTGEPGPAAQAERARKLVCQHRSFGSQPLHATKVSVLLRLG